MNMKRAGVSVKLGDRTVSDERDDSARHLSESWPDQVIEVGNLRLHFGLGDRDKVEKAEVLWPNGKTEVLTNLAADRFYSVREGAGVVSVPTPPTQKAASR